MCQNVFVTFEQLVLQTRFFSVPLRKQPLAKSRLREDCGKQIGKVDEPGRGEAQLFCFCGLSGKIKSSDLLCSASSFFLDTCFILLSCFSFVFCVYKSERSDTTLISLSLQLSSDLNKIMKKSKFTLVVYSLPIKHQLPHPRSPLKTCVACFPTIIDDLKKRLETLTASPLPRAMRLKVLKGRNKHIRVRFQRA